MAMIIIPITLMAIFPSLHLSLNTVPEVSPSTPSSNTRQNRPNLAFRGTKGYADYPENPFSIPRSHSCRQNTHTCQTEPLHERALDELSHEELLELARAQKVCSFFSLPRNLLVKKHITNSDVGRNNFQLRKQSTPPSSRMKFKPCSKLRDDKKSNPSPKQASSENATTTTQTRAIFKSQCQGPFASSPLVVRSRRSSLKAIRRTKAAQ